MIGRAWKFGDGVDTDQLAPGAYMKGSIEELARHCLEAAAPDFAGTVKAGDFVVAGRNFGAGSSREQAAMVLRILGVKAVIAQSFAGIFYRNAFNLGLPAVVCPRADDIADGDRLEVNFEEGRLRNATRGVELPCDAIPPHLVALIADGGLIAHLKRVLDRSTTETMT